MWCEYPDYLWVFKLIFVHISQIIQFIINLSQTSLGPSLSVELAARLPL